MNNGIADKLVKLRKEFNLSQEDLAKELNLSRQAISKWERGESSPDIDNIIKLAKFYSVSFNYLFGEDNKQPSKIIEKEIIVKEIEVEEDYANWCALISFVLSLISILCFTFLNFLSMALFPIIIVLGCIGLKLSKEHYGNGKVLSILGIAISILSAILSITLFI